MVEVLDAPEDEPGTVPVEVELDSSALPDDSPPPSVSVVPLRASGFEAHPSTAHNAATHPMLLGFRTRSTLSQPTPPGASLEAMAGAWTAKPRQHEPTQ